MGRETRAENGQLKRQYEISVFVRPNLNLFLIKLRKGLRPGCTEQSAQRWDGAPAVSPHPHKHNSPKNPHSCTLAQHESLSEKDRPEKKNPTFLITWSKDTSIYTGAWLYINLTPNPTSRQYFPEVCLKKTTTKQTDLVLLQFHAIHQANTVVFLLTRGNENKKLI